MVIQGLELSKRPHIVVATPGRLADHLESCNTFSLQKLKFVVLDEADRLLSGQFDEQLQTIFSAIPKKRQNLLFSATMTDALEKVKQMTSNEVCFDSNYKLRGYVGHNLSSHTTPKNKVIRLASKFG